MERLTYEPVPNYDRGTATREIESGDADRLVRALLALAFYDADWHWVQDLCVNFSDSPVDNVRGTAILCFGYIAAFMALLTRKWLCRSSSRD